MAPVATTVDRCLWSTRWVKILGLKVNEYKPEVGYRFTNGLAVLKLVGPSLGDGYSQMPAVREGG
ncbi:MAG: hypothetical protein Q3999_05275 [Buchananella hordeovulneris]|nr:hypothetical protein [Buchananella hordeovulneris]